MDCASCRRPFPPSTKLELVEGKLYHVRCVKRVRVERVTQKKHARVEQERTTRRKRKAIDENAVHARDCGVCAICKLDTTLIRPWLESLPGAWEMSSPMRLQDNLLSREAVYGKRDAYTEKTGNGQRLGRHRDRAIVLLGRLWKVVLSHGAHFAEIDHITPIAEGGTDDLDNLRTLCRRDHRIVTTELRERLARRPTKAVGRGF